MLLPDVPTALYASRVAARLLQRLRVPFQLDDREAHVDASVGVVLNSPTLTRSDDLLQAADIALYQAKTAGRATYRLFKPGMVEKLAARMDL